MTSFSSCLSSLFKQRTSLIASSLKQAPCLPSFLSPLQHPLDCCEHNRNAIGISWIELYFISKGKFGCFSSASQRCLPAMDSDADYSFSDCLCQASCWAGFWFSEGDTYLSKPEPSHHIISQTAVGYEMVTWSHDQPEQESFWKFSSKEEKSHIVLPSVPLPLGLCEFSISFYDSLKAYLLSCRTTVHWFFQMTRRCSYSKSCLSQWP